MTSLVACILWWTLSQTDRPQTVIELDDAMIQGTIRKPGLMEVKGSKLQEKIEETALSHLIRLEKRLLAPNRPSNK